jgi:hypothetical protein
VLVVLGCLLAPVDVGVGRAQGNSSPQSPQAATRKPGVDRTTPALQQMTERQRAIAHALRGYSPSKTRLLDDQASVDISDEEYFGDPNKRPQSLADFLHQQKCSTDSTFLGTVSAAQSFPTEDGTFLFTEYQVQVTEPIRIPPAASDLNVITMIRSGGQMLVEGVSVAATVASTPHLEVGRTYLFFASYNPNLDVFETHGARSTLLVTDTLLQSLRSLTLGDADLKKGAAKVKTLDILRAVVCR